jgi:hypothetical protein
VKLSLLSITAAFLTSETQATSGRKIDIFGSKREKERERERIVVKRSVLMKSAAENKVFTLAVAAPKEAF